MCSKRDFTRADCKHAHSGTVALHQPDVTDSAIQITLTRTLTRIWNIFPSYKHIKKNTNKNAHHYHYWDRLNSANQILINHMSSYTTNYSKINKNTQKNSNWKDGKIKTIQSEKIGPNEKRRDWEGRQVMATTYQQPAKSDNDQPGVGCRRREGRGWG